MNQEARNKLITEHWPLVKKVTAQMCRGLPPNVDRGEAYGSAALCLVAASETYRPVYGIPFERYATIRMRGAIRDAWRRLDWVPRRVRATTPANKLRIVFPVGEYPRHAAQAASFETELVDTMCDTNTVADLMDALTTRQRHVIQATFFDNQTLLEVAGELGVTESRVCQIRSEALRFLRRRALATEPPKGEAA